MNVVFCWARPSGYMAACWRALAARPGVNLTVLAYGTSGPDEAAPFADRELTVGINIHLLDPNQRNDNQYVSDLVRNANPDTIVVNGWHNAAYSNLAMSNALRGRPTIMAMDNPWLGSWRQRLAKYKLARFLRRVELVVVTGERCWQYARHLGFPESRIKRGVYGIDFNGFEPLLRERINQTQEWPRQFLYIGRYTHVKAIDVLRDAYQSYRESVNDPWPLACCGRGEQGALLEATPGVENHGFVQPGDLGQVQVRSGAFVLASRYDPWPLVIVEACAGGLPVICTEACGSSVELIRPYYNGITVGTEDSEALASAMLWMHENHDRLPEMGRRAQELAAAYSAEAWAERWMEYLRDVTGATA